MRHSLRFRCVKNVRQSWSILAAFIALVSAYLLLWPVVIDPVAWDPPADPGYVGVHALNRRLARLQILPLPAHSGPEDVAVGPDGWLYVSTHEGDVVRYGGTSSVAEVFVRTGGRPLGLDFDGGGRLWIADGLRGLLSAGSDGRVVEEVTEVDGAPVGFADDVAVGSDGTVYFTDASAKFSPRDFGGTYPASLLDIFEHRGHGRVYAYRPADGSVRTLAANLQFANGVALCPDERCLLVAETGHYRILKIMLPSGEVRPLLDELPGFPDNVETAGDGVFWVGLVSARSRPADVLAPYPWLRKLVQRLPAFIRPQAVPYPHLIAIDADGRVLADLQAPGLDYAKITGARPWRDHLVVTSLTADDLGYLRGAAATATTSGR